jgi:hypothetical protein
MIKKTQIQNLMPNKQREFIKKIGKGHILLSIR